MSRPLPALVRSVLTFVPTSLALCAGILAQRPDAPAAQAQVPAPSPALVAALNRFGVDLFELGAAGDGNVCAAPTSVAFALLLTHAGARGKTAAELEDVLLPKDEAWRGDAGRERVAAAAGALLGALRAETKGVELSIVNDLWPQRGHPLRDDYLEFVKRAYDATLRPVDFHGDTAGARKTINDYVATQTRDRIRDLLSADVVTPDTLLILTNAVYFKADWAAKFDGANTRPAPFHRMDGSKVDVPTMRRQGRYEFANVDGIRVLRMPYVGGSLAMEILLPDDGTKLDAALEVLGA